TLRAARGGRLNASRTRIVRDIAVHTDEPTVEDWLTQLSEALFQFAQSHANAMEALRRRLW
ncbi:MAG: hypothetical protein HY320_08165, partial [Armatimonadetes bacterium]|nr:hypothetical protein [Armatimonadota bacterium]